MNLFAVNAMKVNDPKYQIILTNTHNALRHNCWKYIVTHDIDYKLLGIDPEKNIDQQSADLHKYIIQCAGHDAYSMVSHIESIIVANCIGSIDEPYATVGSVTTKDVARKFVVEILTRWEITKDLIIFETLTTREEIEGLSIALQKVRIDNFAIGLTCNSDGRTFGGVSMAESVELLSPFNPQAYFIQCTRYDLVEKALLKLSKAVRSNTLIGVYANDGRGWDGNKKEWIGDRVTPAIYAEFAKRWYDAGAMIIGGCCGTRPEHIAELHKVFSI